MSAGEGDIETSSSFSVLEEWEIRLRDIAAGMLEMGLPVEKIAKTMKISTEELKHILNDLPRTTTALSADDAQQLEVQLTQYPKKFICARTGKLMSNPVIDANGNYFEHSNTESQYIPNSYLIEELTEFKKERVDSILEAAPKFVDNGFHAEAARLLESAQGIAHSMAGGEACLKQVLTTAARLVGDDRSLMALVKFMAQHRDFVDLARGFQEFKVVKFLAEFSSDELWGLFNTFEAMEPDGDGKDTGAARVAIGRALLVTLTPLAADERACAAKGLAGHGGRRAGKVPYVCRVLYRHAAALEHLNLLHKLYALEPASDFCDQLASVIAFWAPQHYVKEALACLPTPVLESAAAQVVRAKDNPTWRSATIICAAAERLGAPAACSFYRHVLSVDPSCAQARRGLMSLLLSDLEAGTASPGDTEELAHLLVEHGAFDTFAKHFRAIVSFTKLEVSCFDALVCEKLSEALFVVGLTSEACGVLLAAAHGLEDAGNKGQAFTYFKRVLEWDGRNAAAEAGVKRLSVELGCEWEAATHLLVSLVRHDAMMASRVTDAIQLLERSVKQELAATRHELMTRQTTAQFQMNKDADRLNKEWSATKAELMAIKACSLEIRATAQKEVAQTQGALAIAKLAIERKVTAAQKELGTFKQEATARMDELDRLVKMQQLTFRGFTKPYLNGTYIRDDTDILHGRETYRHVSKKFRIYRIVDEENPAKWMINIAGAEGSEHVGFARTLHVDPSLPQHWQEPMGGKWVIADVSVKVGTGPDCPSDAAAG